METIAVLSDTHIPDRAAQIPGAFVDALERADRTIHAGDFTTARVLEEVRTTASGPLTAVSGNMDPASLDLPDVESVRVDGLTLVVTHGTGSPRGYDDRIAAIARERGGPDAIGIGGHTHEILDTTVGGTRVLNPGSATGARPASRATMLRLEIDDGDVDVRVLEA